MLASVSTAIVALGAGAIVVGFAFLWQSERLERYFAARNRESSHRRLSVRLSGALCILLGGFLLAIGLFGQPGS